MSDKDLATFRNEFIGFVFQFHHLLPEFSALENVMMPALINRTPRKDAEEHAAALLTRTGLGDRLSHRPSELSGGEQQRVAIARALVMKPRLVLADEPTGNLDPQTSHEIHKLLLELNEETQITFLVATHNFALASQMRRHLRIHDGGIQETNRDALLKQGTYLEAGGPPS
jgi:lipoprotein-releasing system ATP-binding protein